MRIVTLNTWKNEGDYPRRLAAMVAGLHALTPDIVLLQEVFRTCDDAVHTARSLAEALRLAMSFAPARRRPRLWQGRDTPSESGLAILVRGTVSWSERVPLPSDDIGGERIALLVKTEIDGACVIAGCMHLSHVRGDHARRREQLETILGHAVWNSPAAMRVLGGDCNATLDAPALSWLDEVPDLVVRSVRPALDAAPTHPLPPRHNRAGRAIDHLFTVCTPMEPPLHIAHAGVALTAAVDGIFASDHAAVVADLGTILPIPSVHAYATDPHFVHPQPDRARCGRVEGVPARTW